VRVPRLVLVGRDEDRLDAIATDLKPRSAAEAAVVVLDCSKANVEAELDAMVELLGGSTSYLWTARG